MKLKPIKEMGFAERGKEIGRLRRVIERWAKIYKKNCNERCHEEDEKLASVVGIVLECPMRDRQKMTVTEFKRNCDKYINREVSAGRLIDDRSK